MSDDATTDAAAADATVTDDATTDDVATDSAQEKGSIKKLLNGFGFISREGKDDIYFHSGDLIEVAFDSLNEGDEVQFDAGSTPKGPRAERVSKV